MAEVAYVSPLPPAPTGVSSYSTTVLRALDEIGFRHSVEPLWPVGPDAHDRIGPADVAVYHVGNNVEFHGAIYELAVKHPGVVVLHDLALEGLMWGLGLRDRPLVDAATGEAIAASRLQTWREADWDEPLRVPWCIQVARRARAVIVHSEFNRTYLDAAGSPTPVLVAPHPLVEDEADIGRAREQGAEIRARFSARGVELLVGIVGDINAAKGIEETIRALPAVGAQAHLVLVGHLTQYWNARAIVLASGQQDRVTIVPDPSDSEFLAWMSACDVVVNVRHPHRGEASGTLMRSLQAGVCSIVSATGAYLELPDDAVVRVRPGRPDADELASTLTRLAREPELRSRYGERGRAFVLEHNRPDRTARVYERAIEGVLEGRRHPVKSSIGRWAAALAELGTTADAVRRGFGGRYADALDEVMPEDEALLEESPSPG
jgi:glycosyltransferase involved in cell wall biosynthesis